MAALSPKPIMWPHPTRALVYLPVTWTSFLPQSWSLLLAMGLCHFVTLALALLVLLQALAQVDTQKMIRAQCGLRLRACSSNCFLQLPTLPLSHCLQSPQVGMGRPLSQDLRLLYQGPQGPLEGIGGGSMGGEWEGILSVLNCPWPQLSPPALSRAQGATAGAIPWSSDFRDPCKGVCASISVHTCYLGV